MAAGSPGSRLSMPDLDRADPFSGDVQLALHACYETHYRGFDEVDPDWEWDPALIDARIQMERVFLSRIRAEVTGGTDVDGVLDTVSADSVRDTGISQHLRTSGTWWQTQEYFAHRSIYQLKEADPQAWVIPRLEGAAKCALVAVEFDEFGGGDAERMHSRLFEDLLDAAGLDSTYLAYVDLVPAETLATVNFMSLCGLRRSMRGALVGGFAAAEISTSPSARRMIDALERLQAPPECVHFYAEHVEADAVHEQVLRRDVVDDLIAREPGLAADVVLGVQATELLEERLSGCLLGSWARGNSSLLAVGAHGDVSARQAT
ncbi:iron-containing redox enzyme family protein [Rhodococcus sp. UNC363MFTsu5.1]|uniref:iron-containing redox enzyme family protein n=1 Tax=Rhodococcus sp. UNC363MFTsu5.1 TaxID=1449069 RepID=UPI001E4C5B39|nr:iron-containing redox enzyme family protein [Rhodococcus sp. UNC363MFTsu5.1]